MAASVAQNCSQKFDAESVIAVFVRDASRSVLELPHMTTGQRKQVKKLIETYSELTCESFGFGQDRQLHLFKRKDDVDLSCLTRHDVASDSDGDRCACSTGVPTDSSSIGTPATSSPTLSPREVLAFPPGFAPPPGLEVRHTFVHFGRRPSDERAVQSMPRGMFRQELWEEIMTRRSSVPPPPAVPAPPIEPAPKNLSETSPQADIPLPPAVPAAPLEPAPINMSEMFSASDELSVGTKVVIDGLQKAPTFNGLEGTIHSYDDATGRYEILLETPVNSHRWAKVKRCNLLVSHMPPPPTFSPVVTLGECDIALAPTDFPSTPTWDERSDMLAR